MQEITWDVFLETGNAAVDDDHRQLFALINALADTQANKDRAFVTRTVRDLEAYTIAHFEREERMMAAVHWPCLAEHQRLHAAFRRTVAEAKERIETRWRPWLGGSLFVVAADFLLHHIVDEDRRVAVFARTGRVLPRVVRKPFTPRPEDVAAVRGKLRAVGASADTIRRHTKTY